MNRNSENETDPQSARREQDRIRREDAFLEAAESLFAERGFSDASMEDIAHRAGFATGTIYRYFPSKQNLYEQILQRRIADYYDVVLTGVMEVQSARDKIRSMVRSKVRFFQRNRDFIRIYSEGRDAQLHTCPESEAQKKFFDLVHDVFVQACKEGLCAEQELELRESAFRGMTQAVLLTLLARPEMPPEDEVVELLIQWVELGVAPAASTGGKK